MPTELSVQARLAVLRRNDRPLKPEFALDEKLYHRMKAGSALFRDNWDARLPDKLFELTVPEQSVTRSAIDGVIAEDALLNIGQEGYAGVCNGHGVIYFLVSQLPQGTIKGGNDDYVCRAVHKPYPANYAHSEIRLARKTAPDTPSCTDSVRRKYRTILRNNMVAAAKQGRQQIALRSGDVVFV